MNAIMGLPAAGMRVARVYERWLRLHDARSAREGQRGRVGYVRLLHRTSGDMLVSDSEVRIISRRLGVY
jgi:hypothetical protein